MIFRVNVSREPIEKSEKGLPGLWSFTCYYNYAGTMKD